MIPAADVAPSFAQHFDATANFLAHFLWAVVLGLPAAPTGKLLLGGFILCAANTALIPILGAAIRSIRGPFEPIIRGGPVGLGPRGSSSQSRAW